MVVLHPEVRNSQINGAPLTDDKDVLLSSRNRCIQQVTPQHDGMGGAEGNHNGRIFRPLGFMNRHGVS